MALRFVDGFDSYTSTSGADYQLKYDTYDNSQGGLHYDATGGRFGGGCLYLRDLTSGTDSMTKYFVDDPADVASNHEWVMGFWWKSVSVDSSYTHTIFLGEEGGTSGAIRIASNTIGLGSYGNSGASAVSFNAGQIGDGQWHWIEVRAVFANAGSCEVWVDGIKVGENLSVDTLNSGTGKVTYVTWSTSNGLNAIGILVDDAVIYDDVGTELRSSVDCPIGPLKIETSNAASTGANQDFDGVGGSTTNNYLNVDEAVADDDTSYNGTETSTGAVDTFGYASLASTGITQIVGTMLNTRSRKEGLGDIAVRGIAVSSASTSNGDAWALSGGYTVEQAPFVYDPATSTRWTTAGLDAAEFGYATSSST